MFAYGEQKESKVGTKYGGIFLSSSRRSYLDNCVDDKSLHIPFDLFVDPSGRNDFFNILYRVYMTVSIFLNFFFNNP